MSARTGVSKSMLSKIELGLAAPTAVLLGRIAEGLDVSISRLVGGPPKRDVIVMRASEQPIFRAPKTGFERRSLSPVVEGRSVDVVLNVLPPRQSSGFFPAHRRGVEETLIVTSGRLRFLLDRRRYELNEGDSILYRADKRHRFDNPSTTEPARFYIVVDNTRADYWSGG
jgi:quercetin dioxygenase-like cupin family protein